MHDLYPIIRRKRRPLLVDAPTNLPLRLDRGEGCKGEVSNAPLNPNLNLILNPFPEIRNYERG
jgi:hypothetical protein